MLDLQMPRMSGMDVLKVMMEEAEFRDIPVIVLTADQSAEVECLKIGAMDFIPKPYPSWEIVRARVNRCIELSEKRNIIHSTERDGLTRLFNLDYFLRYVRLYDQHYTDMAMDAIVVDINHFRMINERYGKQYGDAVLGRIGAEGTQPDKPGPFIQNGSVRDIHGGSFVFQGAPDDGDGLERRAVFRNGDYQLFGQGDPGTDGGHEGRTDIVERLHLPQVYGQVQVAVKTLPATVGIAPAAPLAIGQGGVPGGGIFLRIRRNVRYTGAPAQMGQGLLALRAFSDFSRQVERMVALLLQQFAHMSYEPVTETLFFEGEEAKVVSSMFQPSGK